MPLPRRKKNEEPEDPNPDLTLDCDDLFTELTGEQRTLVLWRIEQLIRVGVDASYAGALAAIRHLDLHQACDLKARGCSDPLLYELLS